MLSLLSSLLLCAWCIMLEYGSISRFEGVFSEVWGFRVGLFVLALFVACVVFVRV